MTAEVQRRSLRRYLLLGILLPVGLLVSINTVSLYSQALAAINTAYDRTLLASTKSIGEQLDVTGYDAQATLRVTVPYAALEAFEADNQSRLFLPRVQPEWRAGVRLCRSAFLARTDQR